MVAPEVPATDVDPGRPLHIAVGAKQVPLADALELGSGGRLRRDGVALEMNPYCRRAVAKGVELAATSGGTCTVFTLGPPSAEDLLREAVAWGATSGVHLTDPSFAGSDTLATSRALAAALAQGGPFDLVLFGRSSIDGDTGQVPPQIAQLLGLPYAEGVRRLSLVGNELRLGLEHDDRFVEVEIELPAVLSVAERLCDPCKVDASGRFAVPAHRIRTVPADALGPGPWGEAGSATRVGATRVIEVTRERRRLRGDVQSQVIEAVQWLTERGALGGPRWLGAPSAGAGGRGDPVEPDRLISEPIAAAGSEVRHPSPDAPVIGVLVEPGRAEAGAELLGGAESLARGLGGQLVAILPPGAAVSPTTETETASASREGSCVLGSADQIVRITSATRPRTLATDDIAAAVIGWARRTRPWALLATSTAFGREVAARTAVALGAGLIGDAVSFDLLHGELVAGKPAFAGALIADVTCTTDVRVATVRPGVLALPRQAPSRGVSTLDISVSPASRVRTLDSHPDDDIEVLARAEVVIGVGAGVPPDEYSIVRSLAALLGAELAATRKVTDRGWLPRSRQVGLTGRSIAPCLYIAVGLSGKMNHMIGTRAAGAILAINAEPTAPVFDHADIGIVGDWHEVVPALERALRDNITSELATFSEVSG